MICADCGTPAPRSAGPTWLTVHIRDAHHLPHCVECVPCGAHGVVTSLQEVRDWAWLHGTCGLPDLPELCSALTKKAAARRASARSKRACTQQRVH